MAKRGTIRKLKERPRVDPIPRAATATPMSTIFPPPSSSTEADPQSFASATGALRWSAIVGALLAGLTAFRSPDFSLDDAYIHLAYAKSLRLGDGFAYNPGDAETGFSSPLWALLLSLWPIPTGGLDSPVLAVAALGVLLHAATAMAGAALTLELLRIPSRTGTPPYALTLLGGTLVAATPTLLPAATSGMEVPLAAATLTACAWAVIARRPAASACLAFAAVAARVEALAFLATLGGMLLLGERIYREPSRGRSTSAAAAMLAGATALGMWVAYDLWVSGYPWPNTQYIKGGGGSLAGVDYLTAEVLVWQPWLVGLTGVILLARLLLRDVAGERLALGALLAAVIATWLGIVATRQLHPGTQFYEQRYFALVDAIPAALLPVALVGLSRWVASLAILPVGVFAGLQCTELFAAHRRMADDTRTTHTLVAHHLAVALPRHATVAVEGAGATRFFTPRTMTIVDLVGLNDKVAAHLHRDRVAKLCHFVRRQPTHMVLPAGWVPLFSPTFRLHELARFDDDAYTQVLPARPHRVVLFSVAGIHPEWQERCAATSAF